MGFEENIGRTGMPNLFRAVIGYTGLVTNKYFIQRFAKNRNSVPENADPTKESINSQSNSKGELNYLISETEDIQAIYILNFDKKGDGDISRR